MRLSKNFTLEEFACNDGTPVPDEYLDNVRGLVANLQRLRDRLDMPITVVSGYRTPQWNRMVGGARTSQHLIAKAADIKVKGMLAEEVVRVLKLMIRSGLVWQGGVGVYKNFVHYDIRPYTARWTG